MLERLDYHIEKKHEQDILDIAFPNEIINGQNNFYWSLRNSVDEKPKRDLGTSFENTQNFN